MSLPERSCSSTQRGRTLANHRDSAVLIRAAAGKVVIAVREGEYGGRDPLVQLSDEMTLCESARLRTASSPDQPKVGLPQRMVGASEHARWASSSRR
jgi:hypothetical protein